MSAAYRCKAGDLNGADRNTRRLLEANIRFQYLQQEMLRGNYERAFVLCTEGLVYLGRINLGFSEKYASAMRQGFRKALKEVRRERPHFAAGDA